VIRPTNNSEAPAAADGQGRAWRRCGHGGGGGAPVAAWKQGSVDLPTLVNSSLQAWQDIWPDGYARMGFAGSQTPGVALARGAATIEIGATAMVSAAAAVSIFFMAWPFVG
jgi:hypothetical protein